MGQTAEEKKIETVTDRVDKVLKDSKTTREEVILFESRLKENLIRSSSLMNRSFLLFLACILIWIVLDLAQVPTIEFFGMTFRNLTVPLVVLLPAAAYFYWRYSIFRLNTSMLKAAIYRSQVYLLEHFQYKGLIRFTMVDTGAVDIEWMLHTLESRQNDWWRPTVLWIYLLGVTLLLVPALLLGVLGYFLIVNHPTIHMILRVFSVVIMAILVVRVLILWINSDKLLD